MGGGEKAFSLNTIHEQPPKTSSLNSVKTVKTGFNIFSSIGVRLFRKAQTFSKNYLDQTTQFLEKQFSKMSMII